MIPDRKGGEKIFSIWWFFIIVIVATTIVIGVLQFYSADINVKEIEAQILTERVLNCLNVNGYLNAGVFAAGFDVLGACHLSAGAFAGGSNFFFEVLIYDNNGKEIGNVSRGNGAFKADCSILESEKVKAERYPKCFVKEESILYREKGLTKIGKIRILAASNQAARMGIVPGTT